ncbi:cytochrome o ubiquinol oxidase subunit IV [Qipengyuania pelagi]|jgi:cytochrome o ubiquinol oxidase operon protein cyoD|uniref:Cytochrome bo(3) ubiquinol oxidase subunit 4 n=1 Tax=Qipengyuania pelagi TaxID=994320 RepID=A0A844Y3Z8_9SPHN|nr:cytochrome C oxidase subunit IV family protein [Qipengyuania pelagi]MXO53230.1 cytochrome-c oxidase [Qipengyuania pelagi]
MSRPNTGELDPKDTARAEIRSYAIGFVASLLLTSGAFAAHLSGLSAPWKIALICAAALVQIVVHLRNFLHLSFSGEQSREDLLLVLFSVCLLAIMAGGTWYVMADLGERMHQGGMDGADMRSMSAD